MHIPANARGHTRMDWLDSWHTFSFGEYYNPALRGFRVLRVINEDRIDPKTGFPTHGHRDMEIISWVLEGALEHRDTLGTVSRIEPGQIQRMSAGKGIEHSEWNAAPGKTHFLQIWILPNRAGLAPTYDQKTLPLEKAKQQWLEVASPSGGEHAVKVHQDARILYTELTAGTSEAFSLEPSRGAWIHVLEGAVSIDDKTLSPSDGLGVENAGKSVHNLNFVAQKHSKLLLFDLP